MDVPLLGSTVKKDFLVKEPEHIPEHHSGGDKFEEGAGQEAEERAQGGFDGISEGGAVDDNLGDECPQECPDNHTPWREEYKAGEQPYQGAPASRLAAPCKAGELRRNDIVEDGDHDRYPQPDEQELERHLAVAEEVEQQQGAPAHGRTGNHRQKAADDTNEADYDGYDVDDHVLFNPEKAFGGFVFYQTDFDGDVEGALFEHFAHCGIAADALGILLGGEYYGLRPLGREFLYLGDIAGREYVMVTIFYMVVARVTRPHMVAQQVAVGDAGEQDRLL